MESFNLKGLSVSPDKPNFMFSGRMIILFVLLVVGFFSCITEDQSISYNIKKITPRSGDDVNELIGSALFMNSSVFNREHAVKDSAIIDHLNSDTLKPIIYLPFYNNLTLEGIAMAIYIPDAKRYLTASGNDEFVITYADYSNYNFITKDGSIAMYDINREDELIAVLHFNDGDIEDIDTVAPCDENNNGNVGFWECYRCMVDACDQSGPCDFMCDMFSMANYILGPPAAPWWSGCDVSMGAACVYISLAY